MVDIEALRAMPVVTVEQVVRFREAALTQLAAAQKDASFWRSEVERLAKDKNVAF